MRKKLNFTRISNGLKKTKYYIKAHAPEILDVVGTAGVLTGFGLCIRSSFKAKDILDEEGLTKESAGKILFVYKEPVIVTLGGLTAFNKSAKIRKRNYKVLSSAYYALTANLAAKEGLNSLPESSEELTEEGTGEIISDYQVVFTQETAPTEWSYDLDINRLKIKCVTTEANSLLHEHGHIFLNEIFDMLGIERTYTGSVVGWALNDPNSDHFVEIKKTLVNVKTAYGWAPAWALDFNVGGDIRRIRFNK